MNNNYFRLVTALILVLVVGACDSRRQTSPTQTTDSTVTANSTASDNKAGVDITGHLADLGLTPDSHWRGINLGDAFATVKDREKGEPFERDAKHVGYTVEFKNLESADMLYYQTDNKISAIEVDLFLNARQSVDEYERELASYFTARYRAPKTTNGSTVWTGPAGEAVTMKDVSKGKDFGLKVKIASADGVTTASKR